jgi:hypothetical protein
VKQAFIQRLTTGIFILEETTTTELEMSQGMPGEV